TVPVVASARPGPRIHRRRARGRPRRPEAAHRKGRGLRAVVWLRGMRGVRRRAHQSVPTGDPRRWLRRARGATGAVRAPAAARPEPAACCLAGLEKFSMERGATVLVIGGGIMGLLTMVLARRRGARRLMLSDPIEERRAIAKKLGAHVVIDPTKESLRER